jgi:predicted nucleotidyltransferase
MLSSNGKVLEIKEKRIFYSQHKISHSSSIKSSHSTTSLSLSKIQQDSLELEKEQENSSFKKTIYILYLQTITIYQALNKLKEEHLNSVKMDFSQLSSVNQRQQDILLQLILEKEARISISEVPKIQLALKSL